VFQVERTTTDIKTAKTCDEIMVGVIRRDPKQATPPDLLAAARHHWIIENQVHWTRDVTGKDDGCCIRPRSIPRMLVSFRKAVWSWLDLKKKKESLPHSQF
jgi:hypothetical protein